MVSIKILLAVASLVLLADLCHSATIRDSIGRQINFPENPETETDAGVQPPQSRGFIQRIFDMIKNLFGFESTRTTVMRSDGTVEEVDVPSNGGGGGFLSRISNRLMNFISSILNVITGDNGSPRLDGYRTRTSTNEIERELMKMAKNQQGS